MSTALVTQTELPYSFRLTRNHDSGLHAGAKLRVLASADPESYFAQPEGRDYMVVVPHDDVQFLHAVPDPPERAHRHPDREARSDELRERVRAHIDKQWGGHPLWLNWRHPEAQRYFCEDAVFVARSRGLRLWRANSTSLVEAALSSLRTLLELQRHATKGVTYTGVNEPWVLNIWEAAISGREAVFDLPASEPDLFASESREWLLGDELLEAYVRQDDDLFLVLCQEVNELCL